MQIKKTTFYLAGVGLLAALLAFSARPDNDSLPATVLSNSALIRNSGGTYYRDLNKNGKMDIYEDVKQPVEKRVQDLLKQMTLQEKAGMMFYSATRVNPDGSIEERPATDFLSSISPVGVNEMDKHFITILTYFLYRRLIL